MAFLKGKQNCSISNVLPNNNYLVWRLKRTQITTDIGPLFFYLSSLIYPWFVNKSSYFKITPLG